MPKKASGLYADMDLTGVISTLESRFRIFDVRTQHAEEGFASVTERAHKATVWLSRHTPRRLPAAITTRGSPPAAILQSIAKPASCSLASIASIARLARPTASPQHRRCRIVHARK